MKFKTKQQTSLKVKKRKEWGTQQDIQEFMYGKEKTAIPLKEYQTKNKEYRHAFNSWRPLNSQAYEIFNSSSKSADDLKEFAAILEKALEHKQQILALKLFATKREHLDISKMWF